MRTATVLAAAAVLGTLSPSVAAFNYSVWLSSHPQAIAADGRSQTTISAEVRDSSGRNVPDGTVVDFTTSIGVIERDARTAAGVARVRLQSDTIVGTAIVSAVVANGGAVGQLRVDFLEPGTEMFDESFISVSSRSHLGYDVGGKLIDSAGGVKIYHRGLNITAEEAQIDVERSVLRAKARMGGGDIVIRRGEKQIAAGALYYDFTSMSGVILTPADDGAKRLKFRGRDLFAEPDESPDSRATFDFDPIDECTMFIKADSLLIRPAEEIKFRRARFYLDGDRVLSVPLHVEPLRGDGAALGRMLTYGTDGLRLDLPFYYSLTPAGTGSLRLRHSQQGGWGYYSGPASGWRLDLEQEYATNGSTEGVFSLNNLTSGDWGARWTQRAELDNDARLYTYLDFPAHRSLFGSADYSRSFDSYTMSFYARGDKMRGADPRYSTSAHLQSRPKPLVRNAVNYAFTTRLSYDNYLSASGGGFGGGLGLQLYGRPVRFGATSGLSTSLSVTRQIGGSYAGSAVYANAGYHRGLGRLGFVGLNYSYAFSDSGITGQSAHRISTNLSLTPSPRLRTYVYATHGLSDGSTSAFAEASYTFGPLWRLHLLGTWQLFEGFRYTDAEVAVARAVGKQEARLIWSRSRNKFRVEFSALSF